MKYSEYIDAPTGLLGIVDILFDFLLVPNRLFFIVNLQSKTHSYCILKYFRIR